MPSMLPANWLISTGAMSGSLTYQQVISWCRANNVSTPPTFTQLPTGISYNGAAPGFQDTLPRPAFGNTLLTLFYNGNALLPGIHYTLTNPLINLGFTTYDGENVYAVYIQN